jgi:hypothetical protein
MCRDQRDLGQLGSHRSLILLAQATTDGCIIDYLITAVDDSQSAMSEIADIKPS